jgi:hypothetical protein
LSSQSPRSAKRAVKEQTRGRCHVWMSPADQGPFFGVTLIVGAVMSSAFRAENFDPLALMLSADPLP